MESISHTFLLDSPFDVAQRYDLAMLIQQLIDGPPGVIGQGRGRIGADLKQPRSKRWPPFEVLDAARYRPATSPRPSSATSPLGTDAAGQAEETCEVACSASSAKATSSPIETD